jgi:hypothetical protein
MSKKGIKGHISRKKGKKGHKRSKNVQKGHKRAKLCFFCVFARKKHAKVVNA